MRLSFTIDIDPERADRVSGLVVSQRITTGHEQLNSCDQDNDGVPDDWEKLYFGGPTNVVPGADSDGDGMSNLGEYIADTNPTEATSTLRVLGISRTNALDFTTWTGGIRAMQFLETATSLGSGVLWTAVFTNSPPTPRTNTVALTKVPGGMNSYYRIRANR